MNEPRDARRVTTAELAAAGSARRSEEEVAEIQTNADTSRSSIRPVPPREAGAGTMVAAPVVKVEPATPLFAEDEGAHFRERWETIQTGFVDEPKGAVEEADTLVAEVMQRLAVVFAHEREKLESQWSGGTDASTEDLRQALRRYRTFFDRLLSV